MARGKLTKQMRIDRSRSLSKVLNDPERMKIIESIRRDIEEMPGIKQTELAVKYGIHHGEVNRIVNYKDSYNPFKMGVLEAQIGDDFGNEYEAIEGLINEMRDLWVKIKDINIDKIEVKSDSEAIPIKYFDFYKTGNLVNMIMNLYHTIELSQSECTIETPENKFVIK